MHFRRCRTVSWQLHEASSLLPRSCPSWQGPLSPSVSLVEQGQRHSCPTSGAGPAEQRAPARPASGFTSCWCLPSAENTSGKCGSGIFPQLPGPCCEQPCSRRPSPEARQAQELLLAPALCLTKKDKLLPAEAAHSRPGHVGSASIYSPFSPSQGSGWELPAWKLASTFPTPTHTMLGPFLCPVAHSSGGLSPPYPTAQQSCWVPDQCASLPMAVVSPLEAVGAGG